MFDIRDQVIMITGSTRGIGQATARRAAEAGARVVVSGRRQEVCEAEAEAIRSAGGQAIAVACDIRRPESLTALVERTMERWGRIDTLVCNAAVNPFYGPITEVGDRDWDAIMTGNLRSTLRLGALVLPGMAERGGGSVVIVSSAAGLRSAEGLGPYGVSKAGEIALVRSLAREWGPKNIRVNAVCPGVVQTEFARPLWDNPALAEPTVAGTCLKRLGEPDDIAGAILFLATPASRYVTGSTIVADGGLTSTMPL